MSGNGAGATIRVNGRSRPLDVARLADLLKKMGFEQNASGIAVALNGCVVPRAEWGSTTLAADDAVEIVGAVQGG